MREILNPTGGVDVACQTLKGTAEEMENRTATTPNQLPLDDGLYTVVYPSGEYRTLKFKTQAHGNFAGSTIISYREGSDWTGFGFYAVGDVRFWKSFRAINSEIRIARIRKAVMTIAANPAAAGMAYALKSERCCKCDRPLTVPASIHSGMGPDCAKRYSERMVA